MPIAKYVHKEKGRDGNPVFIVNTPNPNFTGQRLGVTFVNGEGRTRYIERAKRLSEEFGYNVILPANVEPWEEIGQKRAERFPDYGPEDASTEALETELE